MDRKRERRSFVYREILNYAITVVLALLLAFFFVFFLFQTTTVSGDSMSPTLSNGTRVILEKGAYLFGEPERYDIVKFTIRKSDVEHAYIKRIVGLPKETVQIVNNRILIDGKELSDVPFDDLILSAGIAEEEITLGDNEYFVIGDNCNNSEDSRFTNVGAVTKDEIEGRIAWQIDGIRLHKVK
jgi:signal peptidase I